MRLAESWRSGRLLPQPGTTPGFTIGPGFRSRRAAIRGERGRAGAYPVFLTATCHFPWPHGEPSPQERGGIEPRFAMLPRLPTPTGRSVPPVCPGCHASLTSALPPRSNPAGVPVFPGCQKYSLCRANRRRLCAVDNGFLRHPRFQGCFGRLPISHHQAGTRGKKGRKLGALRLPGTLRCRSAPSE